MLRKLKTGLLGFLILVYVSGAIGFFFAPAFFKPYTWITLILTCSTFLLYQPLNRSRYLLSFFGLALIGFLIELVGVKTGLIFGQYHYGDSLGPKSGGVPIIISLNWALLINSGVLLAAQLSSSRIFTALVSSMIIVLLDLFMEQISPVMDMWYFKNGIAGLHNYIGWFCIAFITSLIFYDTFKTGNKKIALIIILLQLLTFVSVYLSELFNFI